MVERKVGRLVATTAVLMVSKSAVLMVGGKVEQLADLMVDGKVESLAELREPKLAARLAAQKVVLKVATSVERLVY